MPHHSSTIIKPSFSHPSAIRQRRIHPSHSISPGAGDFPWPAQGTVFFQPGGRTDEVEGARHAHTWSHLESRPWLQRMFRCWFFLNLLVKSYFRVFSVFFVCFFAEITLDEPSPLLFHESLGWWLKDGEWWSRTVIDAGDGYCWWWLLMSGGSCWVMINNINNIYIVVGQYKPTIL